MIRLSLFVLCLTLCTIVSAGDVVQGPQQAPSKVGYNVGCSGAANVGCAGERRAPVRRLFRRGQRRAFLFGGC